jgi:serine/threonine-protein kinase
MALTMNPYLNRVMIQEPRHFHGRRRELSRIFSRIGVERPQSVSVVGERRIGKSSLLYQLSLPEVQERFLPDRSLLVVVFLDFQQLRNISLQDFFLVLINQIRRADPEIVTADSSGYRAFQQIQERLRERNKRLVLLFDEFDAITSNPIFDREFYSFLRSVANNSAVAYVTSSMNELQRLCYSSEIADSPFFNIFSTQHLKPFEKEDALELIAKPSEQAGIPLAAFAEDILDMAGLFPFYIQIACSSYYDWLEENPGAEPDRAEIEARFLEEAGPHFEYFWEQCLPECQRLLKTLMKGGQPGPEESDICRRLAKNGYLLPQGQHFRIFSRAFAERIRELDSLGGPRSKPRHSSRDRSTTQGLEPLSQVNQYQVVRQLAEGGMGVVYQAKDTFLSRTVALKVIKPDLIQMEGARKRFLQEARLAAALSHPAITTVYELLEHEDQVVLVMEWLEGKTLKEKITQEGRQEWRQLAQWLMEACSGLEVAHRQGIVHRDIKTSNLMITGANHLKILDFGLAKHRAMESMATMTSDFTAQGVLLGTLDYMSPEQSCGQSLDHRSDLFSLGTVLFEGLTGQLPFRRSSSAATLQAIVNEPTPDLRLYQVEEAEPLNGILQKLMAKQPERRYASVTQAAGDLAELLKRGKGFFPWLR